MPVQPGAVASDQSAAAAGVRRALPVRRAPAWPIETWWIIAAAAVASVLALLSWGCVLWQYLQPSAFSGRVMLGPPGSPQFALFVGRAVAHTVVLAGVATAPINRRLARALLFGASAGILALLLYDFARSNLFQWGLTSPRRGPDYVVNIAIGGAWYVSTAVPHLLLAYAMLWRPPSDAKALAAEQASARASTDAPPAASGELGYYVGALPAPERSAIVLLAGVNAVAQLLEQASVAWVALAPLSFKTIGVDSGWYPSTYLVVQVALHLAVAVGAAALLLGRRSAGRRALLSGGIGFILLVLYGFVHFQVSTPPGYPRYVGAERVVNTVASVARIGTSLIVYALVIAAVARRPPRERVSSDAL